jgi:hypothetical protein
MFHGLHCGGWNERYSSRDQFKYFEMTQKFSKISNYVIEGVLLSTYIASKLE